MTSLYDILGELRISYSEIEHAAVMTVAQAKAEGIESRIDGTACKNLFVKSRGNFYLIFIAAEKRADLRTLAKVAGEPRFSFASETELSDILNLPAGSVTPLAILNDTENRVTVLLDKELEGQRVLLHPNLNTKTLSLAFADLVRIIEYAKHRYILF